MLPHLCLPPEHRAPVVVASLRDSVVDSVTTQRRDHADRAPSLAVSAVTLLRQLPVDEDSGDVPGDLRPAELAPLRDWLQLIAD